MKLDRRTTKNAVFLIDEKYCTSNKNNVPSGWDYDHRGSAAAKEHERNAAHAFTTSGEGKYPMTYARTFMVLEKGQASFVHTVHLKSGDGYFVEFYSTDGKTAINLTQKNGRIYCNDTVLPCTGGNRTFTFGIEFDLDTKTAEILINGTYLGEYPLNGNDLYKIKQGYKAGSIGSCDIAYTGLWINYLVCDRNAVRSDTVLPYGWQNECEKGSCALNTPYFEGMNLFTYRLNCAKNSRAAVSRSFKKTEGVICFDIKFLTKNNDGENVKLSLTADGKECLSILDNGTKSYCGTKDLLRSHYPYVWQRIRIDADTKTSKALIWHNGKKCGYVDFDEKTSFFDGIRISYTPENGGTMLFTDVFVYEIQPEPEDYPKPPVLPTRKDTVYTGMNICSLWREGSHYGWENIVNFEENMPILGPYDEGNPEVADWEIKYMAEHGLDCEFYCWYSNQENAPFVKTNLSDAMENGHFYAKYGDKVKFALIWEAGNGRSLRSFEDFKNYYVPYWIDHFFSDERYFRIDGVAILAIFALGRLIKDLGGREQLKECFEYLKAELIKIGYKGLAVISNTQPNDDSVLSGTSASYAYHWGYMGHNPDHQKNCMNSYMATNRLHVVPTVSVGYNDIAWRVADRVPYITPENFGELIHWSIDTVLSSYKDKDEEWQRKLLMFSTWNEFGEGTFISPAGLNGFGYLNEMRKALTEEGDCFESEHPSENAYNRLGYLFPRGKKLLCTPQTIPNAVAETEVYRIDFTSEKDVLSKVKDIRFENITPEYKDGKLCGTSTAYDPKITFSVDLDASEIDAIKIKMRAVEFSYDKNLMKENPLCWRFFFATDTDKELSWNKSRGPQLSSDTAFINKCTDWKGKVITLRLDPTNDIGLFEIDSIVFLKKDKKDIETFIDGTKYYSHYPSKTEDSEIYVSFEPHRDFHRFMNFYYEWDDDTRTLMTEYDNSVYYWTENSDTITSDKGDIKMKKPLEFYDGLPYVPLSALKQITGCSFTLTDNRLEITTLK